MSPARPRSAARVSRATENNECDLVPLRAANYELAWDKKNKRLVISIGCQKADLAAAHPSGSGKSRILSTTSGFVTVPVEGAPGLRLSLTATLPVAG